MGHCNHCGAPCHQCVSRSDYSLLSLPESIRGQIKKLLDDVGCTTQERQDTLVASVSQYDEKYVLTSLRIWSNGGHVMEGKDERYFMGILKKHSVSKQPRLEDLPPLVDWMDADEPDEEG